MDQRRSREELREEFKKRLQEENNRKDGGYYANLFKSDINIPFWNCKDGYHTIDIIDYIGGDRDAYPGKLNWVFEFFTYSNLGAGKGNILCLSKTFGMPDPIAEEWARMVRNGADQKKFRSKYDPPAPRALFNIVCADNKEEEMKGIQVFHTSSYLLTDYLREMAKVQIRPGMEGIDPIIDFCDPKKGKSIKFKREGTTETTKFILHQFVDRPPGFEISQKLLDSVFTLGDLIYIPTYDEVCEYYWGKGQHQPGAESLGIGRGEEGRAGYSDTSRQGTDAGRSRFDEASRDVPGSIGEPPVSRGEAPITRGEAPVTRNEPAPLSQREQPVRGPEAEAVRGTANLCPAGHAFAMDVDKYPKDCEPCPKWRDCARAAREAAAPAGVATQPPAQPAAAAPADPAPSSPPPSTPAPDASAAAGGERRRRRM